MSPNLSDLIWSVADLLRGDYKQADYGNPRTLEGFMRLMVDLVYEGFERRRAG